MFFCYPSSMINNFFRSPTTETDDGATLPTFQPAAAASSDNSPALSPADEG
jgi:hypothetical protein